MIATVPSAIKMSPIHAEALGISYVSSIIEHIPDNFYPWMRRLRDYLEKDQLVLRPILVDKKNYIHHLLESKGWKNSSIDNESIDALDSGLNDEFYWLVEISIPELFAANRRKVGEVLITSCDEIDINSIIENFVMARLPGYFVFTDKREPDNIKFQFVPSSITSHVEVYSYDIKSLL